LQDVISRITNTVRFAVRFVSALLLLIGCLTCAAQQKKDLPCMNTAQSQIELDICASKEAKLADEEMTIVYRRLLAKIANNALATTKVKASERAWIAYRDAYVEATYPETDKQLAYGTMYPMEVDLLIKDLTIAHTVDLKDLLKSYEDQ
jgi:uncharacterized protein YecT (DUF1311 family)